MKFNTRQKILDYVMPKMIEQGQRCYNESSEICMYFDKKTGSKCIIGQLINRSIDSKKLEDIELNGPDDSNVQEVLRLSDVDVDAVGVDFLTDLQMAHDEASSKEFVEGFLREIKHICGEWKLVFRRAWK